MLFWCITTSITSWLWKLMFLIMCQKKFCFSMIMLKFYILLLTFSRSTILLNATMRFMIRNSWSLFMSLKNDNLNWKTQFFLLMWLQIIKILNISSWSNNSIIVKLAEINFYFVLISRLYTVLKKLMTNLMFSFVNQKISLKREIILMNIFYIKIRLF